MSQSCPHCGLFSPDGARHCDCGYDFFTKRLDSSVRQASVRDAPRLSDIFSVAFLLHLGAATVSTASGVAVALALGLAGKVALFAPVVVAAGLTGLIMASRVNAAKATLLWLPATIWFVGWAVVNFSEGLDHFMRVFVGTGYCGDFSCAGQLFVTSPLVGSVSYLVTVRGHARTA